MIFSVVLINHKQILWYISQHFAHGVFGYFEVLFQFLNSYTVIGEQRRLYKHKIQVKCTAIFGQQFFQDKAIPFKVINTLFKSIVQLLVGYVYYFKEHLNKGSQLAFVKRAVANIKRFVVFVQMFFYRIGNPITDEMIKLS